MNRKRISPSFWYWLLGIVFLLLIFTVFVFQHNGYIMFTDLSASFNLRNPFEVYFNTYTLYDGEEIGIKNRTPLALILWGIGSIFGPIFGNEAIIKVMVFVLYVFAYSSFYILLPKFERIFDNRERGELSYPLRMVLSLMYCMLPFYTYRLMHVHLFFFSVFYPVCLYLFIRLVEEKQFPTKYILALSIAHFFSLTTPHTILYLAITYIVIFGIYTVNNKGSFIPTLARLCIALLFTILLSSYWLWLYFTSTRADPSYVVSKETIEALSSRSNIVNFLTDTSEWYMGTGNNLGTISEDTGQQAVQLVGICSVYIFGIVFLFSAKDKKYVWAGVTLMLIVLLLSIKESPIFSLMYSSVVFSKFGWLFREVNRIHILWSFWTFLFFSLGIISLSREGQSEARITDKLSIKLIIWGAVAISGIYYFATLTDYLTLIKPVELPKEYIELQSYLSKESSNYGLVYYYPRNDTYQISWDNKRFPLANESNYNLLAYYLPLPPAQRSGGHASTRTKEDLFGSYVLNPNYDIQDRAFLSSKIGIRYVLVDKSATPTNQDFIARIEAQTQSMIAILTEENGFKKVLENKLYVLFENTLLAEGAIQQYVNRYQTTEDFRILGKLPQNSNYRVYFTGHAETPIVNAPLLISEDGPYSFLNLIEESYKIYPYDYIRNYGLQAPWGRASMAGKVNADFNDILREQNLTVLEFERTDKVSYSNAHSSKPNEKTQLVFWEKTRCVTDCQVLARVLKSPKGGKLNVKIGSNPTTELNLYSEITKYEWLTIYHTADFPTFSKILFNLEASDGFVALTSIAIVPKVTNNGYKVNWTNIQKDIPNDVVQDNQALEPNCQFSSNEYVAGMIPRVTLRGNCSGNSYGYLPIYEQDFLVFDRKNNTQYFTNDLVLSKGDFNLDIYLITRKTVTYWIWFIPCAFLSVILFVRYNLLERERKKLTEISFSY